MANTSSPQFSASLTSTCRVVFDDEFNTFTSSTNGSVGWLPHLPFGGAAARNLSSTDEIEYLSDPSVGVNPFTDVNGVLGMTASIATTPNPMNLPYNSGGISSLQSEAQLYGYFEVRAELPAGAGLWSAFWMVPTNGLSQAELDVFEVLGNNPSQIFETAHGMVNGAPTQTQDVVNGINASTAFHTYGVDWEPTTITFYIDGVAVNSMATPATMNTPMMMILDLAVGGASSWPGAPTSASEFPATMQIDYVRAYATANTVDVTGTATIPTSSNAGTASIAGQLLYSATGTGVGVAGLNVALVGANGDVVANAATDSNGLYKFTGLAAGTYEILYTPPNGEVVGTGGPANSSTNETAAITLTSGQNYTAGTETLITTPATIQGQAVYATTSVTTALAGATVQLHNAAGTVIATTTSNSTGNFSFTNLAAGSYQVGYVVPAGEALAAGGPANVASFLTGTLTASVGQVITLAAETFTPVGSSLSGQVLTSASGSGGVGQAGIAVQLLNASGAVVLTTTTNATGNFLFTNLAAATYSVHYAAPAGSVLELGSTASPVTGQSAAVIVTAGQALAMPIEQMLTQPATITGGLTFLGGAYWAMPGMTVSLVSSGGATIASAVSNTSGTYQFTDVAAGTYQLLYVLPTNTHFYTGYQNYTTGLSTSFTVAAGQAFTATNVGVSATSAAIINGTVVDAATGGGNPVAQAGVTVSLISSYGTTLMSTTTSSSGAFQFKGLLQGSYQVSYTTPAGDTLVAGGPASASGLTSPIALVAGQTLNLAAETLQPTLASLSGAVTYAGAALVGETVTLLNSSGATLATTSTSSTGGFQFAGLAAGTYQVKYSETSAQTFTSGPAGSNGVTAAVTLAAGQTMTLATEALMAAPAVLTGSVTYAGAALVGETVTLLNTAGATVATTTTGSTGSFLFSGLAAGSYQVKYSTTPTQIFGAGPANNTTGITAAVALAAGQTVALAAEALVAAPATLSGSVTYAGAPQAGETVTLLNPAGTAIATTTTASNGGFAFSGLAAGTYQVDFSATSAQIFGTGPANSTTGISAPVTLVAGQSTMLSPEALLAAPATLSGSVTYAGAAQAGAAVTLLDSTGATIATTTTGAAGTFGFSGLAAGSYQVQYATTATQILGAGPANSTLILTPGQTMILSPEALLPAPATLTGTVTYAGAIAAGTSVTLLDTTGATIATATTDATGTFGFSGLAAGTYQVQYSDTATQVFGAGPANATTGLSAALTLTPGQTMTLSPEALLPAPATLSGSVTYAGAAQAGAAVTLLDSTGATIATTTTGAAGTFGFSGLAAGSYQVQYGTTATQILGAGPANSTLTLTPGQTMILSPEALLPAPATLTGTVTYAGAADAGTSVTLLDTTGASIATATTDATGTFGFSGLAAGTYQVQYSDTATQVFGAGPANATTGLSAALTLTPGQTMTLSPEALLAAPATLSGSVTYAGAAQAGAAVTLLDATGTTIAATVTDATGGFSFGNLAAGSYQVQYSDTSAQIFASGPANSSTGISNAVTLTPGQSIMLSPEALLAAPATLTGSATYAGAALSGETVVLLNAAGGTVATTTTGTSGAFGFSGLAAGAYQVKFSDTSAQVFGSGPANSTTGISAATTLAAGQTMALANEALLAAPATLSGSVQTSLGGTGAVGLAGATVTLLNAAGTAVASTVSGSTGSFQFANVAAGTYQLRYTPPTGQTLELASIASQTTGLTAAFSLAAGQTLALGAEQMLSRPNSISGLVNHYGSGDPGTGESGVSVSLLNSSGAIIASTLTNGGGTFSFGGVQTGSYQLLYTPPAGQYLRSGYEADPTTGLSPTITLGQITNVNINKEVLQSSSNTFTLTGTGATAIRGAGTYVVTGNASNSMLTLGAGNQNVSLTGGADTITVGAGSSTISALGGGNVIAAGSGMNFISTDGSAGNVFLTNTTGQGTDTISGFNTLGDMLDLKQTLSGLPIASDFSNLGSYVTASVSNGSTTLALLPSGGGTPYNFAVLNGVTTSVAALVSSKDITLA